MKRDVAPISAVSPSRYNCAHARTSRIVNAMKLLFTLVLAVALWTTPPPVQAMVGWQSPPVAFAKGISLEEATNIVRRAYGGRVLSATPATQNGKRGYKVRVLLDGGRVKTVFVDSNGSVSG